jgi:hypothetical protein
MNGSHDAARHLGPGTNISLLVDRVGFIDLVDVYLLQGSNNITWDGQTIDYALD